MSSTSEFFLFFALCMRACACLTITYRPYRLSRSREIVTHQGQEAVTSAGRVIFALLQFAEMNISTRLLARNSYLSLGFFFCILSSYEFTRIASQGLAVVKHFVARS